MTLLAFLYLTCCRFALGIDMVVGAIAYLPLRGRRSRTLMKKFASKTKMSDDPKPPEKSPAPKDDSPAWIEPFKKKFEELLVSWGPAGLLMGLAVHFLVSQGRGRKRRSP